MLNEWWSRIRFFVAGKKRAEVDEEIAFHLEREMEANLAAGMSPAEVKRRATIVFGSRERAREECREERPSFLLESLGRDLRFGVRGLWRNPGFRPPDLHGSSPTRRPAEGGKNKPQMFRLRFTRST